MQVQVFKIFLVTSSCLSSLFDLAWQLVEHCLVFGVQLRENQYGVAE